MSQLNEAQFSQLLGEFVSKFNSVSNEKWTLHKVSSLEFTGLTFLDKKGRGKLLHDKELPLIEKVGRP